MRSNHYKMTITTMKNTARIAGFLYLLQIPLGVFGIMYLPKALMAGDDWQQTAGLMLAHEGLLRLSIFSAVLCALVTIATAYYIRKVLSPVNARYARAIWICTLVVTPISLLNELAHIGALLLLKSPLVLQAFSPQQVHALLSVLLQCHAYGMQLVGIFFGLWLLPMAYLVIKSTYIPRIIGYFLILTCIGYLADFTLFFLFPSARVVISEYTWPGEVMMVGWLLTKGVRGEAFRKYMATSSDPLADPAQ